MKVSVAALALGYADIAMSHFTRTERWSRERLGWPSFAAPYHDAETFHLLWIPAIAKASNRLRQL